SDLRKRSRNLKQRWLRSPIAFGRCTVQPRRRSWPAIVRKRRHTSESYSRLQSTGINLDARNWLRRVASRDNNSPLQPIYNENRVSLCGRSLRHTIGKQLLQKLFIACHGLEAVEINFFLPLFIKIVRL